MFGQTLAAYVVAFAAMGGCALVIVIIATIVRRNGAIGE